MSSDLAPAESAAEIVRASRGFAPVKPVAPLSEMTGSSFLPRLQMFGAASDAVKSDLIPVCYAVVTAKDVFFQLGKSTVVYPVTFRRKAIDMRDKSNIITVYDVTDPEFARIQEMSEISNSRCAWGPEFLLWVPSFARKNRFCTFFMGSKSARRSAQDFDPIIEDGGFATLSIKLLENPEYKWHNPVISPYTGEIEMPSIEMYTQELDKFLKPPSGAIIASETQEGEAIAANDAARER